MTLITTTEGGGVRRSLGRDLGHRAQSAEWLWLWVVLFGDCGVLMFQLCFGCSGAGARGCVTWRGISDPRVQRD